MATPAELTTYIALFHHRDSAASAIRDLEGAGFSGGNVTVIGGGNGSSYSDAKGSFGDSYGYGGADDLTSIGTPERDRKRLQDGLEKGGTVLVLEGSGERADEIERIFHKHSAGKIDETDMDRRDAVEPAYVPPVAPAATTAAESMVVPVVDEELVVGKRQVDRGGVRVFRRVVEEPVSEQVSLREEHVVVERRPVNRAISDADIRTADQTIELTETAEEAVVGKTARVVEEVRVGKEASDHTETVTDTVRHTEVDVEQVAATTNTAANTNTNTTPRKTY